LYVAYIYVYTEDITVDSEASLVSRNKVACLFAQVAIYVSVAESTLLSDIIRMVLLVIACLYVYVIFKESITLASEASLANRDRVTCLMAQRSPDFSVVDSLVSKVIITTVV